MCACNSELSDPDPCPGPNPGAGPKPRARARASNPAQLRELILEEIMTYADKPAEAEAEAEGALELGVALAVRTGGSGLRAGSGRRAG